MATSGKALSVPRTWDEITPGWMTDVLAPHFPGAVVGRVELGDVTDGTTSRARARLSYSHGDGPQTVFIKGQGDFGHRLLLMSLGILFPEARLFAERELIPLEMPALYGVGVDRLRLRTMIVMEDVVATRGATPNFAT
ncbi:MAG: phosphotransferase, partial [Candidatus Binatia bacterium]